MVIWSKQLKRAIRKCRFFFLFCFVLTKFLKKRQKITLKKMKKEKRKFFVLIRSMDLRATSDTKKTLLQPLKLRENICCAFSLTIIFFLNFFFLLKIKFHFKENYIAYECVEFTYEKKKFNFFKYFFFLDNMWRQNMTFFRSFLHVFLNWNVPWFQLYRTHLFFKLTVMSSISFAWIVFFYRDPYAIYGIFLFKKL